MTSLLKVSEEKHNHFSILCFFHLQYFLIFLWFSIPMSLLPRSTFLHFLFSLSLFLWPLPFISFFLLPTSLPPSLSLCFCRQDQRVATCSSTTSLRSLGMESWCRCSCLSVMSSPPKCLWIGRQTKVNALVGKNEQNQEIIGYLFWLFFFTNHLLYCRPPPPAPPTPPTPS